MRTMLIVGIFFLFLSVVFGGAAWKVGASPGSAGPSPAGKARRNIAIAFALVGLGLLLGALLS